MDGAMEREKTDNQAEKVTKDTQTGESLSPIHSNDAGQSPVLTSISKGTSLEDIGEIPSPGQSFTRKPRSKSKYHCRWSVCYIYATI